MERKKCVTDKKKKIIKAAIEVLNVKGYHECLMDKIALKAGIAKGTVYLYFRSKEELYFSIIINVLEEMESIVLNIRNNGKSAEEQLKMLFSETSRYLSKHKNVMLAVKHDLKPGKGKYHNQYHRKLDSFRKVIAGIIEKGVREGSFKIRVPGLVSYLIFPVIMALESFKRDNARYSNEVLDNTIIKIITEGIFR